MLQMLDRGATHRIQGAKKLDGVAKMKELQILVVVATRMDVDTASAAKVVGATKAGFRCYKGWLQLLQIWSLTSPELER